MDHASEYGHELVSAEEAARGAVRHRASSRPTWMGSRANREKTRCTRWSLPGLAHAATCDLGREDFAHGTGAGREQHDQRLCNYRQDLTAPLTGALPCWRSSWPT